MHKFAFLALLSLGVLQAAQVDFYAKNVQKQDDLIKTDDEIVIFSDSYFIRADKALYNEKTKEVELFGNVNVLRGQKERSRSCYAKVNLENNSSEFKDVFFANNDLEVWFDGEESYLDDKLFLSKKTVISSCNVDDPDWEIRFSDGELNRETQFLQLYGASLHVKGVPVMYLPYLAFGIDTSRQSGLLLPKLELNRDDGFYYEQPIYLLFQDNWDLELRPQIRAQRGFGAYSTLRFMDSAESSGEFSSGFFQERQSYFRKEGLRNDKHFGFELKYLRQNLFKDFLDDSFQEALWIDGIHLNDVDYLNLSSFSSRDKTSLVTSKLSYFLADENNYFATYANYYIDTSKLSNDQTLQEYPSFQYHRFLEGILNNHFQYSFDINYHRYYRKEGVNASLFGLNLPLTYHTSFFDDFLNFNFTESLKGSLVSYTQNPSATREYVFKNSHDFSLYTELSKPYESFFHTLHFGLDYHLTGIEKGELTQDFLLSDEQDSQYFSFKAVQFFYDDEGKKKFKHRTNINYDVDNTRFSNFNNLIEYFHNENISMSNEIEYSYVQKKFTKSLSQVNLNLDQRLFYNLSHAYKVDERLASEQNSKTKYSFVGAQLKVLYAQNVQLFASAWFDTQRRQVNAWDIGYTFQRKCWNYSLVYRERVDPQLTSAGISSKNKSGVYFLFNFYPIGGVNYDFSLQESESLVSSF